MIKFLQKAGLFISFSILIFGCDKSIIEHETFTIEFGSECGWCAGQEFLTISNSKIEYLRNVPCGDEKGTTNKSRNLNSTEWETLTTSFDYSLFLTLEYNNCNVCVDGCDEIIRITENDNSTHELRYSFTDEITGMEILRQKLSIIMDEMRKLD